MYVIATAGHVDHGKSALIRALSGMEPDRWAEEHRRGLTIDLGYAWTDLPDGRQVAFVDVPGHERFVANMLAGVGPLRAVLLVVAADEGWRQQTQEHVDAISALGIEHGVLAISRSDLADPEPAMVAARNHLRGTGLADCAAVAVSSRTGEGLTALRAALGRLCTEQAAPDPGSRARLWIDRVFSVRGAGTVATGTLDTGTLERGDTVELGRGRTTTIRGLESLGAATQHASAIARVAVNLRGVDVTDLTRGDTLVTPDAWHRSTTTDVRLHPVPERLPDRVMAHVGSAAEEVRVRPLGPAPTGYARLTWPHAMVVTAGDRVVLRDPGRRQVLTGAVILDIDPPELGRRGAAVRRANALADAPERLDPAREVARRGFMPRAMLDRLGGLDSPSAPPIPDVRQIGDWLISDAQWTQWVTQLRATVSAYAQAHPRQARMPTAAAADAAGIPDAELLSSIADDARLVVTAGHVGLPDVTASLGAADSGLTELERRLEADPFAAPDRDGLAQLGLGPEEIGLAVRLGRLIDLGNHVVLRPDAPQIAIARLRRLNGPFTTSTARQILDTTRRVAVPLLEFTDRQGWTRGLDAGRRVLTPRAASLSVDPSPE